MDDGGSLGGTDGGSSESDGSGSGPGPGSVGVGTGGNVSGGNVSVVVADGVGDGETLGMVTVVGDDDADVGDVVVGARETLVDVTGDGRRGWAGYRTGTEPLRAVAGAVPRPPKPLGAPTAAGRLAGVARLQPIVTAIGRPIATSPTKTDLGESRTM